MNQVAKHAGIVDGASVNCELRIDKRENSKDSGNGKAVGV